MEMQKSNSLYRKPLDLNYYIKMFSCLKEICLQPVNEGLCHESQIKYYFDRTKLMCVPFEYTGIP